MGFGARLFTWWKNEPFGTTLFTRWRGESVGNDAQGNRYFRERVTPAGEPQRRWVLYSGDVEASKVPAEWHAWLHHTTDSLPDPGRKRHTWEQPHLANRTGTADAWRPQGAISMGGKRPRGTGDYEAWQPPAGPAA